MELHLYAPYVGVEVVLSANVDAAGVATAGEPVLARGVPPFTPWYLRRNEIQLALD